MSEEGRIEDKKDSLEGLVKLLSARLCQGSMASPSPP